MTNYNLTRSLLLCVLGAISGALPPGFAHADTASTMQLLPPMVNGAPCAANTANILTMTGSGAVGTSAIGCASNSALDNSGNLNLANQLYLTGSTGSITASGGATFGNNVAINNGGSFSVAGTSTFTGAVTFGGGASFGDYGQWGGTDSNREWMGKCTAPACAQPFAGQDYMHISGWTNANYGLNPDGQTTTRVLGLFDTVFIPNGKLGIGTDHPYSPLHIEQAAENHIPGILIDQPSSATDSPRIAFVDTTVPGISGEPGSATTSPEWVVDNDLGFFRVSWGGNVVTDAGGTSYLVIDKFGNVGIGNTANPGGVWQPLGTSSGGSLDIENPTRTAQICLNGQCVTSLAAGAAVSTPGSQGPQGLQGVQGPKGDTGAQGPAGPSVSWMNVPLDDVNNFDLNCRYRFHMSDTDVYPAVTPTSDEVVYATAVNSEAIVFVAHNGVVSYLPYNDKGHYYVENQTSTAIYPNITIKSIQKQCD